MNTPMQNHSNDLPLFEPDPEAAYTLEIVTELTGISSKTILHYQEHGLISSVEDNDVDVEHFDDEALRRLSRIEHLRTNCEMNEAGLKLMLNLLDEVERLREDLRSR
jgi:MerR family transcriptional regulator/heat shock protein HspR